MNKKDHVADKLFYHEHLSCMVLEVRGDTLAATAESNTKFPLVWTCVLCFSRFRAQRKVLCLREYGRASCRSRGSSAAYRALRTRQRQLNTETNSGWRGMPIQINSLSSPGVWLLRTATFERRCRTACCIASRRVCSVPLSSESLYLSSENLYFFLISSFAWKLVWIDNLWPHFCVSSCLS